MGPLSCSIAGILQNGLVLHIISIIYSMIPRKRMMTRKVEHPWDEKRSNGRVRRIVSARKLLKTDWAGVQINVLVISKGGTADFERNQKILGAFHPILIPKLNKHERHWQTITVLLPSWLTKPTGSKIDEPYPQYKGAKHRNMVPVKGYGWYRMITRII